MKNPCTNCAKSLIGCVPGKHCITSQAYRNYRIKRMPKIIYEGSKRNDKK